MTSPIRLDFMRSLVLKPVSTQTGQRAEIVAGRGPKDSATEFSLPAGVHQLILDFDENRWISIYSADQKHFGEWGPHNSKMVRLVLDAPERIRVYASTENPEKPTLIGITVFELPA